MKTSQLSNLFVNGGGVVSPAHPGQTIFELSAEDVVRSFEQLGVLVFRDFPLVPEEITRFTDRFTESYVASDLEEGVELFDKKMVRNVSEGKPSIDLHSEASSAASGPKILCFYCNVPPTADGQTTL